MIFQCKPSLGLPIQLPDNVRKFQHGQSDVILFTKSKCKMQKSNTDRHHTPQYCSGSSLVSQTQHTF